MWGQSGTALKGQGSHDVDISLRSATPLPKVYVDRDQRNVFKPVNYCYILFSVTVGPTYSSPKILVTNRMSVYLVQNSDKTPVTFYIH